MARARTHRFGGLGAWTAALAVAVVLWSFAGTARAGEVVIVGHPGLPVDSLSAQDLKRIYVGEKTFVDGVKLQPLDYLQADPAATVFLATVVGMNPQRYHAWWVKEVFHGGGVPPRRVDDAAAVLRFVASQPGAIGFVPAESLRGVTTVKRLYTVSTP